MANADFLIYAAHTAFWWAFRDLRARAEETLLERAFGRAYTDYRARTRRFVPAIY